MKTLLDEMREAVQDAISSYKGSVEHIEIVNNLLSIAAVFGRAKVELNLLLVAISSQMVMLAKGDPALIYKAVDIALISYEKIMKSSPELMVMADSVKNIPKNKLN